MKREEIKAIFPDASDEQLKSVLDINGADVEKVKAKVTDLENKAKENVYESLAAEINEGIFDRFKKNKETETKKEDKPNIAEVIEELKRKNKNKKDNSLSYGDNSNNSFILNNK